MSTWQIMSRVLQFYIGHVSYKFFFQIILPISREIGNPEMVVVFDEEREWSEKRNSGAASSHPPHPKSKPDGNHMDEMPRWKILVNNGFRTVIDHSNYSPS
jgi:hypothetical protein